MSEATASAGTPRRLSGRGVPVRPDEPSRDRPAPGPGRPGARRPARAGGSRPGGRRPLWASTGVKDPVYRDTLYVEELVAPGAVVTTTATTPGATTDREVVRGGTVTGGHARARAGPAAVERLGSSYDEVVRQPADEGGAEFADAWQELLDAVTKSLDSKGVDAE